MPLTPTNCRRCSARFQRVRKGQCYCKSCQACEVDGCVRVRKYGLYCNMHYDRLKTTGELGPALSVVVENGGPCIIEGCAEIATAGGKCNMHYKRIRRTGAAGSYQRIRARVGNRITPKGYRYVLVPGAKARVEHRVIMERHLGRPLLANENVHHIDGDRLNNDLSNLELWVKTQPCGQRAADKVRAALRLLKEYPELLSDEGYSLIALESQAATDLLDRHEFNQSAGASPHAMQEN